MSLRQAVYCPQCVCSDVNYLSNSAPPAATEWQTILRPLRGREPEGIWNLLSIVREMFRRNDSNAVTLLDIITEELLACDQVRLTSCLRVAVARSHVVHCTAIILE